MLSYSGRILLLEPRKVVAGFYVRIVFLNLVKDNRRKSNDGDRDVTDLKQ